MDPILKCLKAAAIYGEKAVEVVKNDLETAQFWFNKDRLMDDKIYKIGSYPCTKNVSF